jgi:hypothetical protein
MLATVGNTVQGLSNRVDTIKTSAEAIKGSVVSSSEAIETTAEINTAPRGSSKDVETLNENVHVALDDAIAEGNLIINATVMDLEGNLEAVSAALKMELRKQKAELDTNVKGTIEVVKDEASVPFLLVATDAANSTGTCNLFKVWTGPPICRCAKPKQSFFLPDPTPSTPPPGHCNNRNCFYHQCPGICHHSHDIYHQHRNRIAHHCDVQLYRRNCICYNGIVHCHRGIAY